MSKNILLYIFFLFFSFLFHVNPQNVMAQTVDPHPIGDLNVRETRKVTITGLDANQKYWWMERKLTQGVLPVAIFGSYTLSFSACYSSDGSGKIERDLGPFSVPGLYKLELYRTVALPYKDCQPVGITYDNQIGSGIGSLISEDDGKFFVGESTGERCCSVLKPVYDKDKDICKKDVTTGLLPGTSNNDTEPTQCTKSGSHCEPESLFCFKTATIVVRGKICKDPNDGDFDPSKHAVCGTGKGKDLPGCTDDPNNPAIFTAIGCIHTDPAGFIKDFLKFATAISGGIAFLMMLLGAFQMITSAGNPETLQAGRDRFQSAIIGLLFVIFAVLLLKIIGVDILGIPGFTK